MCLVSQLGPLRQSIDADPPGKTLPRVWSGWEANRPLTVSSGEETRECGDGTDKPVTPHLGALKRVVDRGLPTHRLQRSERGHFDVLANRRIASYQHCRAGGNRDIKADDCEGRLASEDYGRLPGLSSQRE